MTGSPRPFTRWIQRYDWRLLSFCFCLPAHPTCRLQWPKLIIGLSPMFFFVQGDQVLGGLVKGLMLVSLMMGKPVMPSLAQPKHPSVSILAVRHIPGAKII